MARRLLLSLGMNLAARALPIGAEPIDGTVSFRVWAPACAELAVVGSDASDTHELEPEGDGYFSGRVAGFGAGARYRFRLEGGDELLADPASKFQPEGPLGPSEVVDARSFSWSDGGWTGVDPAALVLYEMHVGTFTAEGTWRAAIERLSFLSELGITAIELMPVADWAGRFGWGYDGVCWFAPTRLYGTPDDFRSFVDAAHGAGLGVILDVVYNHVGPVGSVLHRFSPHYFSPDEKTDWGPALDFDGPRSGPVRELVVSNAGYWISEYHLDGLRLDATQDIHDSSDEHVLAAVTRAVREAAPGRKTVVIAENEPQQAALVRPRERGGCGMDVVWNDDFHHSSIVSMTGLKGAYYDDYAGSPQELVSIAKRGFLYQGQWNPRQAKPRGTPALDLPAFRFIHYLQNHDQVANSLHGRRAHQVASPGRLRAMTALLLLSPQTPLLFQGQEFAASSPFLFFADHEGDLRREVHRGRQEFLRQWPSLAALELENLVADPGASDTFLRCKLDWAEREAHSETLRLHRDLLALRRSDPVFAGSASNDLDGAVLGPESFLIRYFGAGGDDRLLLVNLGADFTMSPMPEPLLCPPEGRTWETRWSSEDVRYGGAGDLKLEPEEPLKLRGHSALLLAAAPDSRSRDVR